MILIVWALAVLAAGPLVVLTHELGHAAAALALTRGPVVVQTGRRALATVRLGRLTLALGPGGLQAGACWHLAPRTARAEAAVAAAGPLCSALLALAAGLGAAAHPPRAVALPLAAVAVLAALDALANAWPAVHPAARTVTGAPQESDGRIVARCLGFAAPARGLAEGATATADGPLARPPFLVLLAAAGVLVLVVSPIVFAVLAAMFAWAVQTERRTRAVVRGG